MLKIAIVFIVGLLAVPLLLALATVLGCFPSRSTSTPPKWETALGARALDASLERRSKGLTNPIAANDRAALAAGAKIYGDSCAGCHGDLKGPSTWGSNDFYPRVPQFWQQMESDLTPEEAFAAIHDGIRYSGMGAWRDQMKDDDIWKVANYVARIHNPSPQQPKVTGQQR